MKSTLLHSLIISSSVLVFIPTNSVTPEQNPVARAERELTKQLNGIYDRVFEISNAHFAYEEKIKKAAQQYNEYGIQAKRNPDYFPSAADNYKRAMDMIKKQYLVTYGPQIDSAQYALNNIEKEFNAKKREFENKHLNTSYPEDFAKFLRIQSNYIQGYRKVLERQKVFENIGS